jgi:hypothetical protein
MGAAWVINLAVAEWAIRRKRPVPPARMASKRAAAPVIVKYTGVLGAADVFTTSNTFAILESIRLDHGYGSRIHP